MYSTFNVAYEHAERYVYYNIVLYVTMLFSAGPRPSHLPFYQRSYLNLKIIFDPCHKQYTCYITQRWEKIISHEHPFFYFFSL